MDQWHAIIDGQQTEPISLGDLRQRIAAGSVKPEDLVWTEGMEQWVKAHTVKELFPDANVPSAQPPYPLQLPNAPGAVTSLVCGIIGMVFACAGLVLGIIAIMQSKKAKRTIKEYPRTYGGQGLATAGLVLGIIATVWGSFWAIYLLFVIFMLVVVGAGSMSSF
jgi:hypothetical protein